MSCAACQPVLTTNRARRHRAFRAIAANVVSAGLEGFAFAPRRRRSRHPAPGGVCRRARHESARSARHENLSASRRCTKSLRAILERSWRIFASPALDGGPWERAEIDKESELTVGQVQIVRKLGFVIVDWFACHAHSIPKVRSTKCGTFGSNFPCLSFERSRRGRSVFVPSTEGLRVFVSSEGRFRDVGDGTTPQERGWRRDVGGERCRRHQVRRQRHDANRACAMPSPTVRGKKKRR